MTGLVAYIPFVNPINIVHDWWYLLLVPLSFGVSMIYRAVRLPSLEHYWRQVGLMTGQVILAMVALAVILAIVVQAIIPRLPVD